MAALYAFGHFGRRPIRAYRHRLHDGLRHPPAHQFRSRRHLYGRGPDDGLFCVLDASLHLHSACDRAHDCARLRGRARGLQAAALRSAHVGHDLRHRRELPAAEPGLLHHGRPCQAVPDAAVDLRHHLGLGCQHQAGHGHHSDSDARARGGACAAHPQDKGRHGHARSLARF